MVSKRVLAALDAAHEAGYFLSIASGRPLWLVNKPILSAGVMDFALCSNGASVYSLPSGEAVVSRVMSRQAALDCYDLLREFRPGWNAFFDGRAYFEWRGASYMLTGRTGAVARASRYAGHGARPVPRLAQLAYRGMRYAARMLTGSGQRQVVSLRRHLAACQAGVEKMGCTIPDVASCAHAADLLRSDGRYEVVSMGATELEITARGVTKGSGAAALMDALGVARAGAVAFGDGGNELVSANYQWLFVSGNSTLPDPYDIRIKNPYYPDGYLHDQLDNPESGGTNGAYSTGHGMYLCRTARHGHDEVHSFFFTQSDIGIVVSVATLPNKQGRQSYLYNYNNQYGLLQRGTRGGDARQKFEITPLRLFRVINKAGNIAVSAYMPATSPLTVPTGLRTSLMTESQYRFFITQAKAAAYNANPTDAVAAEQGAITTAPATGEIFIGYNYVNDPEVMDLSGGRWYNIKGVLAPNTTATSYYYYQNTSSDNFHAQAARGDDEKFMFQFTGNDPYDITIYNGQDWSGNDKQALARENRLDWYYALIQKRSNGDNNPILSFMMLEHEDGYATLAVHNKWYVNGNFNLGTAGDDAYIGMKFYMHYWSYHGNQVRMTNNDSYFTYYSDRNRNGNYATKLVFEPVQYTSIIHIIDNTGREAIKYTGLIDANMPIDFAHIPASIRSPFLIDETITGYTTATANGTSTDGRTIWALSNTITQTPATTGSDIYIRYTTNHVYEKPFRLTGARSFNVRINGDNYVYSTGDGYKNLAATTDESGKTTNPYYWHLLGDGSNSTTGSEHGGDPYAFRLWNNGAGNTKFLKYDTSTGALTLDGTNGQAGTYFIAMRNNTGSYYEVMAAGTGKDAGPGDGTDAYNYYNIGYDGTNVKLFDRNAYAQGNAVLQILLSTNDLKTRYYIVDKAKKIVLTADDESVELQVPAAVRSPLVSQYHYWKLTDFTVDNNGEEDGGGTTPDDNLATTYSSRNDTYTLTGSTELSSITSALKVGEYYQVYVTYDVSDRIQFNGRDKGTDGKMYMLKFANGVSFNQEDGSDGINKTGYTTKGVTTATKAVYPYSNGDANLYIYGEEQWLQQSGNAASTRGRWPWYVVSENEDPYHVKIQSQQKQNDNYNYLRTYKPQDYSAIVTGVITETNTSLVGTSTYYNYVGKQQDGETTEQFNARKARQIATDYMVLGTQGAYQLQTVELISNGTTNERRKVTSFEQYWKTYDTVKKKVLKQLFGDDYTVADDNNTDPKTLPAVTIGGDTDAYRTGLINLGWHAYKAWANAKYWNGFNGVNPNGDKGDYQTKGYEYLEHWFQTIDMGDGTFDFVEISIDPALILIDNHGWEIMRKPIPTSDSDAGVMSVQAISGDVIPAETGVLLRGTAGETYTLTATADDGSAIGNNTLVAVTVPTHVEPTDGDYTNFMLKGGEFIRIAEDDASVKMPANKAYLQLPAAETGEAKLVTLLWDDAPTGISTVSRQPSTDNHYYNLNGQRLSASRKGINIINGRKIVIR